MKFGPKRKIQVSGSGDSTPQTLEQDETYCVFTAEMAVLQIQGILQLCIDEEKDIDNMGIQNIIHEKQAFDALFQYLLKSNNNDLHHLIKIKDHVLKVILPSIAEDDHIFSGKTQLRNKLFQAVINWPIPLQPISYIVKNSNYPETKAEKNQTEDSLPTHYHFDQGLYLSQPGYLAMYVPKTTTMQLHFESKDPNHNNSHHKKKITL